VQSKSLYLSCAVIYLCQEFEIWADWTDLAIRAVLKIYAIFLKYTFEGVIFKGKTKSTAVFLGKTNTKLDFL
jgi:hypothetical protein